VLFADETSVFDRFLHDVVNVLLRTHQRRVRKEEEGWTRTAFVQMMPT
jgi:hypothetical protein